MRRSCLFTYKMLFLLPLIWLGEGLGLKLLRAQCLSVAPGQYSNQRFQDPIHLSPGNYTFTACTFEVTPGNTGIVAESGGLLVIDKCWFFGSGTGSGVVSEKTMVVKHSEFKQLSLGLYYRNASGPADTDNNPSNDEDIKMNHFEGLDVGIRKDGEGKISIVGNTFINNKRAIELGYSPAGPLTVMGEATANISLNFKCNGFFTDETESRTGLIIENGVQVNGSGGGNIGGVNDYDLGGLLGPYPNANYFPIQKLTPAIDRGAFPNIGGIDFPVQHGTNGWPDALNWKSISNQSAGNPVHYFRFSNEFVWRTTGISGEVTTPVSLSNQRAYTGWNENQSPNPPTGSDANACEAYQNFDPEVPVFPTRIAVDSTFTDAKALIMLGAGFGNLSPNPATGESKVDLYLPITVAHAALQIIESSTGKILQSIHLVERGKVNVVVNTSKAPAGSYQYRLLVDGKPKGTKQLIVVH